MSDNVLSITPRLRKLRSLTDCAREIESMYKRGRREECTTQDMCRFVSVLQTLAGLLKDEKMMNDFQERLETLEGNHESVQNR